MTPKRSPRVAFGPRWGPDIGCIASQNRPWNMNDLGSDAARAPNRPSLPAARCAGSGRGWKNAGIFSNRRLRAAREAERDTTGSISRQPPVHTWNDRPVQGTFRGSVAEAQHLSLFTFLFTETVLNGP